MEVVGVVTAVGPGLTGRNIGDVVAYAGKPMGSYAKEQVISANVGSHHTFDWSHSGCYRAEGDDCPYAGSPHI